MKQSHDSSIWRAPRVIQETGLSRPTIFRLERDNKFPKRVRLSANSVGWRSGEVKTWLQSRERV